ncbi:hypothetical protein R1flu_003228 [Riccia fluitans]|uniref:G-protein coupled receptors family 2 profile 2 domain-containing protein n=1 Tax=Riccia fluitans TaxID=41844 RepID=A0ABD1Y8E2_9MARC
MSYGHPTADEKPTAHCPQSATPVENYAGCRARVIRETVAIPLVNSDYCGALAADHTEFELKDGKWKNRILTCSFRSYWNIESFLPYIQPGVFLRVLRKYFGNLGIDGRMRNSAEWFSGRRKKRKKLVIHFFNARRFMAAECCNSADVKNLFGTTSDPPETVGDWIILSLTLVAVIPFIVANLVIFGHRKRKFFQASGWDLILGSSVAGLMWITAALVVNQHFRRNRVPFFGYCALWTFWFQLLLGMCGWLSMITLRLHHIYVVVTTRKKPDPRRIWLLYLPLLLSPALIFCIVATVENVSHHPCGIYKQRCVVSSYAWKLSIFLVLPPIYFSYIIFVILRARKQSDFLLITQYQQAKESAAMAFVLYLLTGTTHWTNRQNNVEGRCFLTFCVCSLVFLSFWVHTGRPVYLCLFKRGNVMDKYEEELRSHGATCLQPRVLFVSGSTEVTAENEMLSESFTFDGQEAIVLAVADAQAGNRDLKIKRETLHRRISHVKAEIEKLKTPTVPYSQSLVTVRQVEKVLPEAVTRHLSLELPPGPRHTV